MIKPFFQTIREYRESTAFNYSYLKSFSADPYYAGVSAKQSNALNLGDIVDMILTQDEDTIFQKYYVLKPNEKISETIQNVLKEAVSLIPKEDLDFLTFDDIDSYLIEAIVNLKYYSNRKPETSLETIKKIDGIESYFEELKTSLNKIVITQDVWLLAKECVNSLRNNNEYVSHIINQDSDIGIEVFYQFSIEIELPQLGRCKILIDKLIVNHNTKEVKPFDIKTTSKPILSFDREVIRFRYDLQAGFYTTVIFNYFQQILPFYTVYPLEFLVVSTTDYRCLPFTLSEKMLNNSIEGFELNGKQYEGFVKIINNIKWFREKNIKPLYPKSFYEQLNNNKPITIEI